LNISKIQLTNDDASGLNVLLLELIRTFVKNFELIRRKKRHSSPFGRGYYA